MASRIPSFLLDRSRPGVFEQGRGKVKIPFVEGGISHLADVIKKEYVQWELSSGNGFLQKIDARIKVLFLLFFVMIVSLQRSLLPELYISFFVFILVLLSRLRIVMFYKRVFFLGFSFGFLVAFPAAFNVITKGEIIWPMIKISTPLNFFIYHIPADIGITREGIYVVARLTMRVINSLSLSFLVLYTTPFPEIIRALKVLKVPETFLIVITLCYKYIFIFSKTVEDMYLAKKSRMVREASNTEAREWIAGRIVFIFRKSRLRCEEVFNAMIGRGFSDTVKLYSIRKMHPSDWCVGILFLLIGVIFLLI